MSQKTQENQNQLAPDEVARTIIAEFIPGRGVLATMAVMGFVFLVGVVLLWKRAEKVIESDDSYILTRCLTAEDGSPAGFDLSKIHFMRWTPEGKEAGIPEWVNRDIREDVLRIMRAKRKEPWQQYSIRDPGLNDDFNEALRVHPWVRRVIGIQKFQPAMLEIVVEYRKPVVMAQTREMTGFLLLDEDARFLRMDDIPPELLAAYPRLVECDTIPLSTSAGAVWNDPKVADAVRIVAAFGDRWRKLNLRTIQAVTVEDGLRREVHYELTTQTGSKIDFGKWVSERQTRANIEKLVELHRWKGTLDVEEGQRLRFQ